MKNILLVFVFQAPFMLYSQGGYGDSLLSFRNNYVQTHEVVKTNDSLALQFYPVDPSYRFIARFEKAADSKWIQFPTSGKTTKVFKLFGTVVFEQSGQVFTLHVYQSENLLLNENYKDYLFLPFTDATTGIETYEAGRYLDLFMKDIQHNTIVLDFNKAYNPYCAYVSDLYNCPLPPKENALAIAVRAGEKIYRRKH